MGLSVSGGSAIIFIGLVVVFGLMFGALDQYQQDLGSSYQHVEETALRIKATSISILDVDTENDTFRMVNDGQATVHMDSIDILLNGTLVDGSRTTVEVVGHPGSRFLMPGEVAVISLGSDIDERRILVVTDLGITALHIPGE